MTPARFPRALAVSAAIHLGALAALLVLAHPHGSAPEPPMRVSLLGLPGRPAGSAGESGASSGPSEERPGLQGGAAPGAVRRRPPPRSPTTHPAPGGESQAGAVAIVTPVQSDIWVLAPSRPSLEQGDPPTGAAQGAGAAAAPGPEGQGGHGADSGGQHPGAGTGGWTGASLLAALSQRLAWSAERCAPAALVRLSRHAVPGVPLHFCLDAAGRPSGVGLLGTTGSDQLDRAARDCVVPGALPLPPAPGCYTVQVRFPVRG